MRDDRLSKCILFGELKLGKRKQSKPKQRWMDSIRGDLKKLSMSEDCWFDDCQNRPLWKCLINEGMVNLNINLLQAMHQKRHKILSTTYLSHICTECGSFDSKKCLLLHFRQIHVVICLKSSPALHVESVVQEVVSVGIDALKNPSSLSMAQSSSSVVD